MGYLGEQIKAGIGERFAGTSVRYAHQREARGTYDALGAAKPLLSNDRSFLCLMGDDLYQKEEVVYGPDDEQLLPFMIAALGQKKPVKMVRADFWFPIAYPQDVKEAEEMLRTKGRA